MTTENRNGAIMDFDVEIMALSNEIHQLRLVGLIYFGQKHFTSRIIDKDKHVWYHDGMITGSRCISEGNVTQILPNDLWFKEGRIVSVLVYSSL